MKQVMARELRERGVYSKKQCKKKLKKKTVL
jgi:hypothetical protein